MKISFLNDQIPEINSNRNNLLRRIHRHENNHDRRYFDTTYKDSWESNLGNIVINDYKTFSSNKIPSGNETGFKQNDRIKINTSLISEKYNVGNDPKYNTSIQRTWNYIKDPGIRAVEEMGINNVERIPLHEQDNYLSLPLGVSDNFLKIKNDKLNNCRKKGTDITKTTIMPPYLRK